MTTNQRIGSINKDHSQSHKREFADKKTVYNEVHLYLGLNNWSEKTTKPLKSDDEDDDDRVVDNYRKLLNQKKFSFSGKKITNFFELSCKTWQ